MCRPLCECLCLCVCTHSCARLRVRVPVCTLMALPVRPGASGLCIHVYACPHAARPQPCVCACGCVCTVWLCVRAHTCVFGAPASCCSAVQHLTPPHTIRGIPAGPGTRPGQPWENGSAGRDGNVSFYGSLSRHCLPTCRAVQVHSCLLPGSGTEHASCWAASEMQRGLGEGGLTPSQLCFFCSVPPPQPPYSLILPWLPPPLAPPSRPSPCLPGPAALSGTRVCLRPCCAALKGPVLWESRELEARSPSGSALNPCPGGQGAGCVRVSGRVPSRPPCC